MGLHFVVSNVVVDAVVIQSWNRINVFLSRKLCGAIGFEPTAVIGSRGREKLKNF